MNGLGAAEATRAQVLERIREDARFVLATHENPDGDALGSLVGMQGLLEQLGKHSEIFIAPDDLPLPLEYRIFSMESLIQAPPADIATRTVVFLDCGNIDRNSARVLRDGAHLINIDHHHDNTSFGTLNYVEPSASCTAEIVWDLTHFRDWPDRTYRGAEGVRRFLTEWLEIWDDYEAGRRAEKPATNLRLEYFKPLFRRQIPVVVHTQGYQVIMSTLRILHDEMNLKVVIDHGCFDSNLLSAEILKRGIPVMAGPRGFRYDPAIGRIKGQVAGFVDHRGLCRLTG